MTNSMYGILFNVIVSVLFLVVLLLSNFLRNKKKFINFSLGLTLSVMVGMIFLGLIPEAMEGFGNTTDSYIWLIFFCLIGFFATLLLDKFIPDHHDDMKHASKDSLMHISVMTSIALVIHNFVEGASLYSITLNNVRNGLALVLAITLHNIPFALTIMLSLKGKLKGKNLVLLSLLVLSTLLGGLFVCLFTLSEFVLSLLISLTLGMIIYIAGFEIFNEVIHEIKDKYTISGIILGIIAVILLFVRG